jgi:hypothetical protein
MLRVRPIEPQNPEIGTSDGIELGIDDLAPVRSERLGAQMPRPDPNWTRR